MCTQDGLYMYFPEEPLTQMMPALAQQEEKQSLVQPFVETRFKFATKMEKMGKMFARHRCVDRHILAAAPTSHPIALSCTTKAKATKNMSMLG